MDSLRTTPKDQLVAHLEAVTQLEEKCSSSKILSGKRPNYIGTMGRVPGGCSELEIGIMAFAEFQFDRCLAIHNVDEGISELLMKELFDCNQIVVFTERDRDLIQKYAPENIKIILE